MDRCPCGRPWDHEGDSPDARQLCAAVDRLVRSIGPTIRVQVAGSAGTLLVARYYPARHGTSGAGLAEAGFPVLGSVGFLVYRKLGAITCARCGLTSWHPKDVSEGYCGCCHAFH